jgi:hypothetical protein
MHRRWDSPRDLKTRFYRHQTKSPLFLSGHLPHQCFRYDQDIPGSTSHNPQRDLRTHHYRSRAGDSCRLPFPCSIRGDVRVVEKLSPSHVPRDLHARGVCRSQLALFARSVDRSNVADWVRGCRGLWSRSIGISGLGDGKSFTAQRRSMCAWRMLTRGTDQGPDQKKLLSGVA